MKKLYCDRCGDDLLRDPVQDAFNEILICRGIKIKKYDLCKVCADVM